MTTFAIETLPNIDQQQIKRGLCPWCLCNLAEDFLGAQSVDVCPECSDVFIGSFTTED